MGEVLHQQPSLGVIILLYQRGADCKVTSIYPNLVWLIVVEHLHNRGTGEGFLQLLEGGFFFSFPREVPVLFSQGGHRLGYCREALHESPVEVCQSQKALHLLHTRQCWPR